MAYEREKHSAASIELLSRSFEMLIESVRDTMATALTRGANLPAILDKTIFANTMKDDNFLDKFKNFFVSGHKKRKAENFFYAFLTNVFQKLDRHKKLFGSSIILSELILNHKDNLIDWKVNGNPSLFWAAIGFLLEFEVTVTIVVVYILYFVALGVMKILNMFPINLENIIQIMVSKIKVVSIIAAGLIFLIWISGPISNLFKKIKIRNMHKRYEKLSKWFAKQDA